MATVVFNSPQTDGPNQVNYMQPAAKSAYCMVLVQVVPSWVGVNAYGGSNSDLDQAARMVYQESLLPHLGVFNSSLNSTPGLDTALKCDALLPVTRFAWTYTWSAEFDPTQARIILLDIPDGFRASLKIAED